MIRIVHSNERHYSDMGWLQTYWLFSFGSYYDAQNLNHGALRVFNDDVVQPGTGFSIHPHEEMEIVTVVLAGEMTHSDTMGNTSVIRAGDVQRMTAGTGLQHSEWNTGSEPVHFFQIWILPDTRGLEPSYAQLSIAPEQYSGRFHALAAKGAGGDSVGLHTDATIYRAALEQGATLRHGSEIGRCQFLYLISGTATVNEQHLEERDQARIHEESHLVFTAVEDSDLILVDVPR